MIGKALNSPKEGVSALTRVGIQFSEQQKKEIEGFIKLNDLAGAQAIILKELNLQFGGQAKALNDAAGGANNLAVAWGNLEESAGQGFLGEFFTGVVDGATKAIGWIDTLINKLGTLLGIGTEGNLNRLAGEVEQRTRNIQNGAFNNNNQGSINNVIALDEAKRQAQKLGLKYLDSEGITIKYTLDVSGTKEEKLQQINDAIKENENLAYNAGVKTNEWWNALKRINALKLQKLQVSVPVVISGTTGDGEIDKAIKQRLPDTRSEAMVNRILTMPNAANDARRAALPQVGGMEDIPLEDVKIDGMTNKEYLQALEERKSQHEAMVDVAKAGASAMSSAFQSLVMGQRNVGQAAGDMAKNFAISVASMIAQAAAFKLVMMGLNAIPGVGSALTWLGLGSKSISSTAPTMAPIEKSLSQVNNSVQALNMNLMKNKPVINIYSTVDGLQFVQGTTAPATNRLNKAGVQLDAIR
jgi:hypothetical protein